MAESRPTRRDFLAASSAVASAALAVGPGAFAGGSDAIRIGIVGCGGRGAGAAMNAMNADPGVRLVAMADLFEDKVRAKRDSLKEKRPGQVVVDDARCFAGFDGYRKVIESVDAVLIACAPKFHAAYLRAAVEAGRHVFVEKPHAIGPPGLRDLVAACETAKQKRLSIVSGLYSRYDPGFQETIQRVRDGAIGDVVAIEETLLRGPYGIIRRTPGLSEIRQQFVNWSVFAWLSGDDVLEGLMHNLDRANWVLGDREPAKCHGLGGRSSSPDELSGSVFDHHSLVYEYAGGVRLYAFCRTQTGCHSQYSSLILGTKGRCHLMQYRVEGETKWRFRWPEGPRRSAYDVEHEVLFKAIRSGTPVNNGDYMVRSTMAAVMGQVSCYTGKELTPAEVMKSDFSLGPKPDECSFDMDPPVKPDEKGIYPVPVPGQTKGR